jgi:hypothetical protein
LLLASYIAESAYETLSEKDDTLGFLEDESTVQCLSADIVCLCIGREFCAGMRRAPLINSCIQCSRNAYLVHIWHDVNAFEKKHG